MHHVRLCHTYSMAGHQDLVDSLVKEYAGIDKLAASILEDRQQVRSGCMLWVETIGAR